MSGTGATFMTYTSLFNDVTNYLERGRTASSDPSVYQQIPRLINAAERKLIQVLKLQGTIEVLIDNTGLTSGQAIVTKPDRWRQTKEMYYGAGAGANERTPLYPRSYSFCTRYWPNRATTDTAQPPLFYADYDYQHWLIAPTPPATYPLELLAYMQPQLLSESNQTNFWTQYTPNALLYSTLMEAIPFIKDDARIPVWREYYQFEISTLGQQDLQKIMDAVAERNRP
jgi:hypothetical protein